MTIDLRGCDVCTPELGYQPRRLSEAHVSVGLGDWMVEVRLNGELILDCREMVAGPGGWAVRLSARDLDDERAPVETIGGDYYAGPCRCGSDEIEWVRDRADGYSFVSKRRPSSYPSSPPTGMPL